MNEYIIRNGFVENKAPVMIRTNSQLRDYIYTEHMGRMFAIVVREKRRPRKRFRLLQRKKYTDKKLSRYRVGTAIRHG